VSLRSTAMRGLVLILAAATLLAAASAAEGRRANRASAPASVVAGEPYNVPTSAQGVSVNTLVMEPLPGQGNQPIEVAAPTSVGGDLPDAARYGNLHAYTEDLKSLVKEMDDSEQNARSLRVKLVDKDNFLESMLKRERLLKIDLDQHKTQLAAMNAHIQATEARVERLKKERQQAELDYQKHSMDSATRHIATTINSVEAVSSALDSRLERTDARVKDALMRETEAMRRSLQPDVAAGDARDEGALQAVAAAAANMPAPATFLQAGAAARGLRGKAAQ